MTGYSVHRPIRNSRRLADPVTYWICLALGLLAAAELVVACIIGRPGLAWPALFLVPYLVNRSIPGVVRL